MVYCTTGSDLNKIGELYKEWTGKSFKLKSPLVNSFFGVAKMEGGNEIVGVAQLIVIDDPFWRRRWGLVENVYVKEGYRKQGIAKALMKFIETQALGVGCDFIKLTSGYDKVVGHKLWRSLEYTEGLAFKRQFKA